MKAEIKPGTKFGRWTTVTEAEKKLFNSGVRKGKVQARQFLCKCECGIEKIVMLRSLIVGGSKSCGCLQKEIVRADTTRYKHGHAKIGTPEYRTWRNMKSRCNNPHNQDYHNYGGRGIQVSPRWNDFCLFLEDMGPKPSGMSIDRIDNNKGYYKENCRWADALTQSRNRRHTKYV